MFQVLLSRLPLLIVSFFDKNRTHSDLYLGTTVQFGESIYDSSCFLKDGNSGLNLGSER